MEITAGDCFAGIGEDQRIIGDGIGLDLQRAAGLTQQIEHGAHHLRLATQAVRVLDLLAHGMAGEDFTARRQPAQSGGDIDLALMAAQFVDPRIKRRNRALGRVQAHRTGNQRALEAGLDAEQGGERQRGRGLGAVEQGQPFLGPQLDRLEPGALERFRRRQPLATPEGLAMADQRRAHMRQRCQIARGPDRALRRDHRQNVVGEQIFQRLQRRPAQAGGAASEAGNLQRQDQAHDIRRQCFANSGGVREHEAFLQDGQLVIGDPGLGQLAETGIETIDGAARSDQLLDRLRGGIDAGLRCRINGDGSAAINRLPVSERHLARSD